MVKGPNVYVTDLVEERWTPRKERKMGQDVRLGGWKVPGPVIPEEVDRTRPGTDGHGRSTGFPVGREVRSRDLYP